MWGSLNLCECGCGQIVKKRFVSGHNTRIRKPKENKPNLICQYCGNKYYRKPSAAKRSKYCCKTCHIVANNKKRVKPTGSFGEWDGYLTIKLPEHPKANISGVIMYHNYVMEKHIGKHIPDGYIVHHIDDNKRNNEINNLVLVTPSVHGKIHSSQKEKGLRKWHEDRGINN